MSKPALQNSQCIKLNVPGSKLATEDRGGGNASGGLGTQATCTTCSLNLSL